MGLPWAHSPSAAPTKLETMASGGILAGRRSSQASRCTGASRCGVPPPFLTSSFALPPSFLVVSLPGLRASGGMYAIWALVAYLIEKPRWQGEELGGN